MKPPRSYKICYEEIVIGSTLPALIFSSKKNIPLISGGLEKPIFLDRFKDNKILGNLSNYFPNKSLRSLDKEIQTGPKKTHVWDWFWFDLGLRGLLPGGDFNKSIQIEPKVVKVFTSIGKQIHIEYNKIHLFSDKNVQGIPNKLFSVEKENIIHDRFDIVRSPEVSIDFLETEDNFVNKIWFVPTKRHERKTVKDALSVSYLSDEQINDFSYSEIAARYKIMKIIKNSPLKKDIKLEHAERKVLTLRKNFYNDTEHVKFHEESEEDLLCQDYFTSQALSLV